MDLFFTVWILDRFLHALADKRLASWTSGHTLWISDKSAVFSFALSLSWAPSVATASRSTALFSFDNVRVFGLKTGVFGTFVPLVSTPSVKAVLGNVTDTWSTSILVPVKGLFVLDGLENTVRVGVFTDWFWTSWITPVEFAVAFNSLFLLATFDAFFSVISNDNVWAFAFVTFTLVMITWTFAVSVLAIIKKSLFEFLTNRALD